MLILQTQISLALLFKLIPVAFIVIAIIIGLISKRDMKKLHKIFSHRLVIISLSILLMMGIESILFIPNGWHDFLGSILGSIIALGGTFLVVKSSEDDTNNQIKSATQRAKYQFNFERKKISRNNKENLLRNRHQIIENYCHKLNTYCDNINKLGNKSFNESWNISHNKYNKIYFYRFSIVNSLIIINEEIEFVHVLLPSICTKYISLREKLYPSTKDIKWDINIDNNFKTISKKFKYISNLMNKISISTSQTNYDIRAFRSVYFKLSSIIGTIQTIISQIINDYLK